MFLLLLSLVFLMQRCRNAQTEKHLIIMVKEACTDCPVWTSTGQINHLRHFRLLMLRGLIVFRPFLLPPDQAFVDGFP